MNRITREQLVQLPEDESVIGHFSSSKIFLQLLIFLGTIFLFLSPYPVKNVLNLGVVFYHEAWHALTAEMTGGDVQSLAVSVDEGGSCHNSGGNNWVISMAGYMGAALVGCLALVSSLRIKWAGWTCIGMTLITLGMGITFPMDRFTTQTAFALSGIFLGMGLLSWFLWPLGLFTLRTLGTYFCLYSFVDVVADSFLTQTQQGASRPNDVHVLSNMMNVDYYTVAWILTAFCAIVIFISCIISLREMAPRMKVARAYVKRT